MRLKHSNKKHRIVISAAQKIINQKLTNSILIENNKDFVQQFVTKKQNLKSSQEIINLNMENSIKSSFKQCKIQQFIGVKNHSPTHSDIQYIDTIEDYKKYLKKNKKQKSRQNKSKQKMSIQSKKKQKINNPYNQCILNKINHEQGNLTRQKLKIIQQKIDKVKNLSFKYSSERQFQNIYEQIYKTKTEQSDLMPKEQFELISVRDYMKLIENQKLSSKMKRYCVQNKDFYPKFTKRPNSHEAKRWYQTKNSSTQRMVDPESLIKNINLDNWKRKKSLPNSPQNKKTLNVKRYKTLTSEKLQNEKQTRLQEKETIKGRTRPSTAPYCNSKKTKISQNLFQKKNEVHLKMIEEGQVKKFPDSQLYLRQRVKGIRHVQRQKYGWKQFKKQIKTFISTNPKKIQIKQIIFQYPWNKKTKYFSLNNNHQKN